MENKKINVQLDFNVSKKIHGLYHSFFNNPPKNINYTKSEFAGIKESSYSKLGKIRKELIKLIPVLKKLDLFLISFLRKESNADLIHFTFHLGNTNRKCVVDYEHAYNFIDGDKKLNSFEKKRAIKRLTKKNLKYLMPINKEALKSFKLFFGENIKVPQEIVYPTIFIPREYRKSVKKKKKVIFISTTNILTEDVFLIKGGLETLNAFEELSKKYKDYEFTILGKIPKKYIKKFPKNLKLIEGVSREKMWEMFNESQIFVQPCYQAPAMAFIEAMFFKLPIITTRFWGNDEYVDNKNGMVVNTVDPNHINEHNVPIYPKEVFDKIKYNQKTNSEKIVKAVEKLIKNPSLRKTLGENGFNLVTKGKFSIDNKNKKLEKIYKRSLK